MKPDTPPKQNRPMKKARAFAVAAAVIAVGLTSLLLFRAHARTHIKTDDAFVDASVHNVASRLGGTIAEVLVRDNQEVKAGDVLVRLDPEPLAKGLSEAEASHRFEERRIAELTAQAQAQERKLAAALAAVERTQATRPELEAALSARQAEVRARMSARDQAELDLKRAESLSTQEVVPRSRLDQARTAFDTASSALAAAESLQRQAEASLAAHASALAQSLAQARAEQAALDQVRAAAASQKEQIARRQTLLELASLNLSFTEVTAPADGFVTRMSAEVGNTVAAGQPLLALVNLDEAFVLANYKETQVGRIQPGQKVRIALDAYPGIRFEGTVDSVMAGTGGAFALFPTENASGNYVKVVQRVPVKITFDKLEEVRPYLRVGMSVVPVILTGKQQTQT